MPVRSRASLSLDRGSLPRGAGRARRRLRVASDGRVPDHGDRRDGEAGPARPHDRALRPRRRGQAAEDAPSASAAGRCAGGAARTPPGASRSGRPSTHLRSRAPRPVFSEATEAAFGANASFRRQLVPGLEEWAATLDGALHAARGMGHHGVSVGDVDGDGLDDVYVCQPEGLPNRLFRNNGDGTFEDVTEHGRRRGARAHVAVALRRRGQRRRPGPDPAHAHRARCCSRTTARAASRATPDAFRFKDRLQGSLTSGALADYDQDGFLDLYLCTYGYFIGVSEDKAGPPSPYHDARNGSPSVLLRNDGHGRFVDDDRRGGLDENNDRFSFAAGVGRLRRGRLARPVRRERLRPQEPVPPRGTCRSAGRASATSPRRPASRTTGRG